MQKQLSLSDFRSCSSFFFNLIIVKGLPLTNFIIKDNLKGSVVVFKEPPRTRIYFFKEDGSNMSEDVACHHDPEILGGCFERLDVVWTLENAFLQLVKTDSRRKKSVFEVLTEGSEKTKRSVCHLKACSRLPGSYCCVLKL